MSFRTSFHKQIGAFTLIELLIVLAIISILAALLFPVFSGAREKARQASCLSNEKQLGMAFGIYTQDFDEKMFFRANWKYSRSGYITPQTPPLRWWNMLMPYVQSNRVWACPSDTGPALSPDAHGNLTVPRSYIAVSTAESLNISQVEDPVETMVITEKYENTTDSWIEPFAGDFNYNPSDPTKTWTAANRHTGLLDCVFFDGHAKAMHPNRILASKDLTGCEILYDNPFKAYDANVPTVYSASTPPAPANVCSGFSWP